MSSSLLYFLHSQPAQKKMKNQEEGGDEENKSEEEGSVREESVGCCEASVGEEEVEDLAEQEDDPLEREGVDVDGAVRPGSHHVPRPALLTDSQALIGPAPTLLRSHWSRASQ